MGLGGALKLSKGKYENAEFCALTATESIPLSSMTTTQKTMSSEPSESSPQSTVLTYDNPHEFLHDVQTGKIPIGAVTLEDWLISASYAALDQPLPELNISIMVGGQLFNLHHCLSSIHYPNRVKPLMEGRH
jgi:hypothetical protein